MNAELDGKTMKFALATKERIWKLNSSEYDGEKICNEIAIIQDSPYLKGSLAICGLNHH